MSNGSWAAMWWRKVGRDETNRHFLRLCESFPRPLPPPKKKN
jgi:hypothetical protein